MNITFEFACRDDCLDKMVPSDLRRLVRERDELKEKLEKAEDTIDGLKGMLDESSL